MEVHSLSKCSEDDTKTTCVIHEEKLDKKYLSTCKPFIHDEIKNNPTFKNLLYNWNMMKCDDFQHNYFNFKMEPTETICEKCVLNYLNIYLHHKFVITNHSLYTISCCAVNPANNTTTSTTPSTTTNNNTPSIKTNFANKDRTITSYDHSQPSATICKKHTNTGVPPCEGGVPPRQAKYEHISSPLTVKLDNKTESEIVNESNINTFEYGPNLSSPLINTADSNLMLPRLCVSTLTRPQTSPIVSTNRFLITNINQIKTTTLQTNRRAHITENTSFIEGAFQCIISISEYTNNCFNLVWLLVLWMLAAARNRHQSGARRKTLTSCSSNNKLHHILNFMMAFSLITGSSGYCALEECTSNFVSLKVSRGVLEGHNAPYCFLLARYHQCTVDLGSACRGDIKFHSDQRMINSLLKKHLCADFPHDQALMDTFDMRSDDTDAENSIIDTALNEGENEELKDECDYKGPTKPRAHCGLFGDPHLRTFTGQFVTCRVLGAWPLLDTPHLAVQVTNERVGKDLQATATTKVTAIVKGRPQCGSGRTYEASTDTLPRAFVDGTTSAGPSMHGGGPPVVEVEEVVPGKHVVIRVRSINATVNVRKIDKYLAVSATLPLSAIQTGEELGLCMTGCPASELLDPPLTPNAAMPQDKALQLCSHYNLTDYFLDSCVFDLMTTGDTFFRQAAAAAQSELWTHDPLAAASTLRNCTKWPCEWHASAATRWCSNVDTVMLVAVGLMLGVVGLL